MRDAGREWRDLFSGSSRVLAGRLFANLRECWRVLTRDGLVSGVKKRNKKKEKGADWGAFAPLAAVVFSPLVPDDKHTDYVLWESGQTLGLFSHSQCIYPNSR